MTTIYIYDNALLGDNGDDYSDESCVDSVTRDTPEECLAEAGENYSSNDYTYSFSKHQ